jgi:hypothetical protein
MLVASTSWTPVGLHRDRFLYCCGSFHTHLPYPLQDSGKCFGSTEIGTNYFHNKNPLQESTPLFLSLCGGITLSYVQCLRGLTWDGEVNVKFTLEQATKVERRSKGSALLFL